MSRRISYFFITLIILFPYLLQGQTNTPETSRPTASACLELGGDSLERRFFRPFMRFDFPTKWGLIYFDLSYYQRISSQLQGEVDFWISTALQVNMNKTSVLEFGLNHFCRHKTSVDYPLVLDINEVVGKAWKSFSALRLGIGAGTYLGQRYDHDVLIVTNLNWAPILQSEFSLSSELKWVDFEEMFYDLEFFITLDPSLDLFIRRSKHYNYPETTYLGLRFNFKGKAGERLDRFLFRGGIFPEDNSHKVSAATKFDLSFFKTHNQEVLFSLWGDIPIKRDEGFFDSFYPDKIQYHIRMDYEKKINQGLLFFLYGRYDVDMPVDVELPFSSSLGFGLGLRNSTYFRKLDKKMRIEIFAGQNFKYSYNLGIRLGLNTTNTGFRVGSDLQLLSNANEFYGIWEVFGEFGQEIKFRPFVAVEHKTYEDYNISFQRFLFGIEFIKWYD